MAAVTPTIKTGGVPLLLDDMNDTEEAAAAATKTDGGSQVVSRPVRIICSGFIQRSVEIVAEEVLRYGD